MKNILFTIVVLLLSFYNAFAQNSSIDLQLANIDQSSVTSGIIYERSSRMANLYEFNQNPISFPFYESS